jgi:hypothetical protein
MLLLTTVAALLGDVQTVAAGNARWKAPRQPQIAIAANGVVHMVFGNGSAVYYVRSESAAPLSFGEPVQVADVPNLALGMRRGPRVAASGSTVTVTAIGGPMGRGRDEDLSAWRSQDGGKTWVGPSIVNDAPAAAREGLHSLAAGPGGQFACAWIDLRTKGRSTVCVSTSTDGARWSPNVVAYESPSGRVCECCQPSIAFDERGNLHLLWRNSVDGLRDMYRSVSSDGGKTFGDAVKLGSGSWTLNACPMDGGGIAIRGANAATVWRRERIVYATFGKDAEEVRLGDGEQPCIAATDDGALALWLKRRPGDLMIRRESDREATVLANDAADPVVATARGGRSVVAAWEGKAGGRPAIFATVIERTGR